MSADIVTQILGITGTITGALALVIAYRTYSSARPKLKVTPKKCNHFYSTPNSTNLTIHSQLAISNCGDRGTTLNKVEAEFIIDSKKFKVKDDLERPERDEETNEILNNPKISINPHSTIDEFVFFETNTDNIQQQEKIDCTFKLFHTHGVCSFKVTSLRDIF